MFQEEASTACVSLEWGGDMQVTCSAVEMKLGWLSQEQENLHRVQCFCIVCSCASSTSELNPCSSQACVMQRQWHVMACWVPELCPSQCQFSYSESELRLHDDRRVVIIPQELIWLKYLLFLCSLHTFRHYEMCLVVSSLQLYNNEVVNINLKPEIVCAARELTNKLSWLRWL